MSRGALSDERINLTEDGNILVKIKTAWKDGTTHVKFTPLEFLEKLVALIPPPWFNLTRYFGILSPHSSALSLGLVAPNPTKREEKRSLQTMF